MCINACDNGHLDQDARPTFLTWQNGQYVPAPPMFYVPGLRPSLPKQPRQARWRVTADNSSRTCASPDTSCAGQAPSGTQPADLEKAISPITTPDFLRNGSQMSRPRPITRSTDCQSDTDAADSRTDAHTNDRAVKQGHRRAQQPPQSLPRAANTSSIPESSSSTNCPPFVVADGVVEADISPVESQQPSRSSFPRFRRPLVELSSGTQNKANPEHNAMPSAATITKPNLEIPKTKSATPRQQHHLSTGTTTLLKSILKKHSIPAKPAAQSTRPRRKHVHFIFGVNEDRLRAHQVPTPVHRPPPAPSPPPLRRAITPPPSQHSRPIPSSTGIAQPHIMEDRARLVKADPRSSSVRNGIKQPKPTPPAVAAQPRPKHPTLTAENLAALSDQQKTRRIHVGRSHEDGDDDDDVASNTDFELAVRMNERAMGMNRRRM